MSSLSAPTDASLPATDAEWRVRLSPAQFRVLRESGTEPAGSGPYNKHYPASGAYLCAGCNAPLYTAASKFDSGCGWPAFFEAIEGAVERREDNAHGMHRMEIVCTRCKGHLGHVFRGEAFKVPTNERHCVNSISLKFAEE